MTNSQKKTTLSKSQALRLLKAKQKATETKQKAITKLNSMNVKNSIVKIFREVEGGHVSGIGFFVTNKKILSARHICGDLTNQTNSSFYAQSNQENYKISIIKEVCEKDLVLFECELFESETFLNISNDNPLINDSVLIQDTDGNVATRIIRFQHQLTSQIQFNYQCNLSVDVFLIENPCEFGMSGSPVLNSKNEVIGLYSGRGDTFGMCINRNEIDSFLIDTNQNL
jgi:hypothetical protein